MRMNTEKEDGGEGERRRSWTLADTGLIERTGKRAFTKAKAKASQPLSSKPCSTVV